VPPGACLRIHCAATALHMLPSLLRVPDAARAVAPLRPQRLRPHRARPGCCWPRGGGQTPPAYRDAAASSHLHITRSSTIAAKAKGLLCYRDT
jgi:hypothetical protein